MEEPQREESQREETVSSFWLHDGTLRPVWKLSSYFTVFIILTIPLSILSMALPVEVDWRISSPLIMLMSVILSTKFLLVVTDRTSFFQATGLRWSRRSGFWAYHGRYTVSRPSQ